MTNSNEGKEHIIRKIDGLKRMMEDAATTAAEKNTAEKLMLKLVEQYCIDMANLDTSQNKNNNEIISILCDIEVQDHVQSVIYLKICARISEAFGCYCFRTSRGNVNNGYKYMVYGTLSGTTQVNYLMTNFYNQLNKLGCMAIFRKDTPKIIQGFCDGLHVRLNELKSHMDASTNMREGLVKVDTFRKQASELAHAQNKLGRACGVDVKNDRSGIGYNMGRNASLAKGVYGNQAFRQLKG